MMRRSAICVVLAAMVAGCASFDGRGLAPGKSTEAEVRALMGTPAQTLRYANGDAALYYSRLPEGRAVYVARVRSDGVLVSLEQRLTRENIAKLVAGTSTREDARELFGPPAFKGRLALLPREWWEYKYLDYHENRVFWVQFSDDGVVREVIDMHDWDAEPSYEFRGPPR